MIALASLRPFAADVLRPSPNHSPRPVSLNAIECVVLHATADKGNEAGAEGWMRNPASQVSAHLHIRRSGTVVRLVPDQRRAWHAGTSRWRGRMDVNSFSLGWELANRNDGREPYTEAQYATVAFLGAYYLRQGIPLDAFVSHAEVALPPGRKSDPAGFLWARFYESVRRQLTPVLVPFAEAQR
jgi:N-acetylmuramoyl-L-alanine amidase